MTAAKLDLGPVPHDPFYKTGKWIRLRRKVLIAANWKCSQCGADLTGKYQGHVDHRFERDHHPLVELEPANLRALCIRCHNLRHGRGRWGCTVDGMPLDPNH